MECTIVLLKLITMFILVFVWLSSAYSAVADPSPSYSLPYDNSIYVEYNDTLEPDPECSVVPACQQLTSQWGDESLEDDVVPSMSSGCQTYVNCYEYSEFPLEIPHQVTILTIQGSFFKNLTLSNVADLPNLVEVIMEFNELRHIAPGAFQHQAKLEILRLHGNKLNTLHASAFRGLSSLKVLDLSNNGITELCIEIFSDLPSLVALDLNLNGITSLGPDLFRSLPLLKSLSLRQNNISFISNQAFRGLRRLKSLSLKQNLLSSFPVLSGKHLPRLSSLFLSRNAISAVTRKDIEQLDSLRHLWLHDCQINDIEEQTFHETGLKTLVLDGNNLTILPDLGLMKRLKVLKLNENPWTCDSKAVTMLRWLLRHKMNNLNVPCYTPMERRGSNLLNYAVIDLANYTESSSNKEISTGTNMNIELEKEFFSELPLFYDKFPDIVSEISSGNDQDYNNIMTKLETPSTTGSLSVHNKAQLFSNNNNEKYALPSKFSHSSSTANDKNLQHFSSTKLLLSTKTTTPRNKKIDDNQNTNNEIDRTAISAVTIVIIVVVTAVILFTITAVAAKSLSSRSYYKGKHYNEKPEKPALNKIKRRRSGKYDLTKARYQQDKTAIYGVFTNPTTEKEKAQLAN